jgi:hypothetical protein
MDILDPQKWMPMIQASVEALLTPFEAMAQRLIDYAIDRLEKTTLPALGGEVSIIISGALNQVDAKTIPALTASLRQELLGLGITSSPASVTIVDNKENQTK